MSPIDPRLTLVASPARVLHLADAPLLRDPVIAHFQLRTPAVARDIAAGVVAVAAYILAALCVGWVVSLLLAPMGYAWPRFAIEAAISTGLGMFVSWRLTNALFPRRSGKGVFAAFVGVVVLVSLTGLSNTVNWLHLAQALLLVGLAYGLFWPHRKPAR